MRGLKNQVLMCAGVLLLCGAATPALAQWTGKGEAGVALASGNSDSKSANAKIAIGHKHGKWEESASVAGNYVRSEGETTARRWELGLQERYSFSGRTYWFGSGRYEKDRFSGFDHQGVLSSGVGHKFIDRPSTHLSGQVGVGYKFYEVIGIAPAPNDRQSDVTGVAGISFDHQLTSTTTLYDKVTAEIASGNNFLQNDIGVSVKMTDRMALVVAYQVRHNSDPPAGFRKTDTLTTLNLSYEVK